MGLTLNQSRALNFIRDYTRNSDVSPNFAEIRGALGLASNSGVHRLLGALRDRGYVEWSYGKARSIRLLDFREQLGVMTATELRAVIAQAAGLAAHKDGDGGAHTVVAMRNIIDRLAGAPRRAAA